MKDQKEAKRDIHCNLSRNYSNVIPDIIYSMEKWMNDPSSNVPEIQKRLLKRLKVEVEKLFSQ